MEGWGVLGWELSGWVGVSDDGPASFAGVEGVAATVSGFNLAFASCSRLSRSAISSWTACCSDGGCVIVCVGTMMRLE